jgi:hypothetical protein
MSVNALVCRGSHGSRPQRKLAIGWRNGFRGARHRTARPIVDSDKVALCRSVTERTRSMAALAGDVGGAAGGAGGAAL